jgi:glycosyltransferase involved in cell wall biosynthesis
MEEKPFTHGKSPTKALQYMAMEVPVVGNMNVGGPAEIAAEGGCISVRTDEEWLDALERLMNPEVHQRYSRAALANIRKNHDQVAVFEKMVRLWAS